MADVLAFPGRGAHFIDECTGSFRLLAEDVPALLATLTDGLAAGYSATTRSAAALGQG